MGPRFLFIASWPGPRYEHSNNWNLTQRRPRTAECRDPVLLVGHAKCVSRFVYQGLVWPCCSHPRLSSYGYTRLCVHEAKPSKALLFRHVLWIDVFLQEVCASTDDPEYRAEIALPAHTGAVAFRFLPQTQSDRTTNADVLIAYNTFSGLSIGKWCHRLRESLGFDEFPTDSTPIFVTREGTPWTSNYFRTTYLIPFLEMQRTNGDMHFTSCDGSPGNTIADHFWSLHSYRRGGRTHVSRRRVGCFRKATAQEIAEHGRWRASRTSMDMPTLYLEWTYLDRISITLLCM
jgi:hypothetical protein